MRNSFIVFFLLTCCTMLSAQPQPVKWSFASNNISADEYEVVFTATIEDGWATYSQFLESDEGPLPTELTFKPGSHYELVGKAKESGGIKKAFDKVFEMNLTKFKHDAVLTQKVKVTDASKPIEGYLTFMVCNDEMCLPPKDVDFSFTLSPPKQGGAPAPKEKVADAPKKEVKPATTAIPAVPTDIKKDKASTTVKEVIKEETAVAVDATGTDEPEVVTEAPNAETITPEPTVASTIEAPKDDENFKGFFDAKRSIDKEQFVNACGKQEKKSSSWLWIFFAGFLGGLVALLTPCVFPMIPLTVSFFLKSSKDRASGLRNAWVYGASIVGIYTFIGVAVTMIFGAQALNEMSTDMYFNLLFFAVFIIFALSFFGLFEITLPSSFVNWSDRNADKGGLFGIFFMAFTLALVSFSCTGPIVGTLLVEAAKSNAGANLFGVIPLKPTVGLFGFGLALALPFALFAAFPAMLSSLPKSGGWMDNVKKTLGFVELALAMKFLSTADLVRGWGLLKFETFMAIWMVLAGMLALYQFGVFGWKGAKGKPGIGRLVVGGLSAVFCVYLATGLFNHKPLSLLSGLAPPVHYSYKYAAEHDDGHIGCPHNLNCFHDFDEAKAYAQKVNLPLFVDFTGHGCVNCRKMEENVWIKPDVLSIIRDKYVLVSLYVDDQKRLFPDNKFDYMMDAHTGEKMRTEGDKWGAFQINNFGTSSQPYYVLMDNDGETILNTPRAYTPDKDEYKAFLECGIDAFESLESKKVLGSK